MAARDIFYFQGLSSYGDSKGAKLKKFTKKIVYLSLRLVCGDRLFFRSSKEWYHFQQELMVSKMVVKDFIISFTMGLESI